MENASRSMVRRHPGSMAGRRGVLQPWSPQRASQRSQLAHDGMIERFTVVDGVVPVETAMEMVNIACKDVRDPNVAGAARWIVRDLVDENVNPFIAIMSEIQAIFNWMNLFLRYTRDPIGVELVYSAKRILDFIGRYGRWAEDCDSQALLIMTFFMAIGRKTRMTIAGFKRQGIYTHVFAEVYVPSFDASIPGRWLIVDPSTASNVGKMASGIITGLSFYPDGKVEEYNR